MKITIYYKDSTVTDMYDVKSIELIRDSYVITYKEFVSDSCYIANKTLAVKADKIAQIKIGGKAYDQNMEGARI